MAGRIKKGDTVFVISGKDKGREGKVLKVYPRSERALVEGANLRKRHRRPRRSGSPGGSPAPRQSQNGTRGSPSAGDMRPTGMSGVECAHPARPCRSSRIRPPSGPCG